MSTADFSGSHRASVPELTQELRTVATDYLRDGVHALSGLADVLDLDDLVSFTCERITSDADWGSSLWQEIAVTDGRRLILWHGDDDQDEAGVPIFTSAIRTIPLSAIVDQGMRTRYHRVGAGDLVIKEVLLYLSTQTPERQVTEMSMATETRTTQFVETYRFSKTVETDGLEQVERLLRFGRTLSTLCG